VILKQVGLELLNFLFYLVDQILKEFEEDRKEQLIEEKEEAFEENSPYIYDMAIFDKNLASTSHTVEWLPLREPCVEDERFTKEFFLMGTHNEPLEDQDPSEIENAIMICSVNIPILDKGYDFKDSEREELKHLSKVTIHKSIPHPQDVSKARALIGNPSIVASFTNSGDINLYDFNLEKCIATFREHDNYGFALCWKPEHGGAP
jgi:hypothetical protein